MRAAHLAAGLLTALAPSCCLAVLAFLAFALYELVEWAVKRDTLYPELLEYAVGLYAGIAARLLFGFAPPC